MPLGKVEALKRFFGDKGSVKPVGNTELIDFRREDPAGFDELAELAATALGETLVRSKA